MTTATSQPLLCLPATALLFFFFLNRTTVVNADDCFQVIFGVTLSVSPTCRHYHMSHQSPKCHRGFAWQLLSVGCLTVSWWFGSLQDALREFWCWARHWKPQISKWERERLNIHVWCRWIWLNYVSVHRNGSFLSLKFIFWNKFLRKSENYFLLSFCPFHT